MGKISYDRDLIVVDEDAKSFSQKVAEFLMVFLFHWMKKIKFIESY